MRPRDLAVVLGIAVIGLLALADTLRGRHSERATPPVTTRSVSTTVVAPGPPQPPQAVPAPGTLVFTDAGTCVLREFDVASGTELAHQAELRTDCSLAAAPLGGRLAVGEGGLSPVGPFRFLNMLAPGISEAHSAIFPTIVWASDGQAALWCRSAHEGFVSVFNGGPPRPLVGCPSAFTGHDVPVYVHGSSLLTAGRTFARGRGRISWVGYPADANWFVVLRGNVAERWAGGRRAGLRVLPAWAAGRVPILAPGGCELAIRRGLGMVVFPLDCEGGEPRAYPGRTLAWSPDGRWLAVADGNAIDFYAGSRPIPVARWRLAAASLAWSPD